MFQQRGWEAATYLVKRSKRSTTGTYAAAAADRIDDLLEGAMIPIDGFDCLSVTRDGGGSTLTKWTTSTDRSAGSIAAPSTRSRRRRQPVAVLGAFPAGYAPGNDDAPAGDD